MIQRADSEPVYNTVRITNNTANDSIVRFYNSAFSQGPSLAHNHFSSSWLVRLDILAWEMGNPMYNIIVFCVSNKFSNIKFHDLTLPGLTLEILN